MNDSPVHSSFTPGDSGYGAWGGEGAPVDPLARLPGSGFLLLAFALFVPLGLLPIVWAGRARRSLAEGDPIGAALAADCSRAWAWRCLALGITAQCVVFGLWLLERAG